MDTKTKLILAAEKLYGERGVDGVSVREVLELADQRNASALTYHFGDRDGLLAAIVDFRRAGVNRRRVQLLDALDGARETDATAIAEALIVPLVEVMARDAHGPNYVRFLSHLWMSDRLPFHAMIRGRHDEGLRRCLRLYCALRPDLPPRLAREIFAVSGRQVVYALADWHRDRAGRSSGFPRGSLGEFEANLIAMTASALGAAGLRTGAGDRAARPVPA